VSNDPTVPQGHTVRYGYVNAADAYLATYDGLHLPAIARYVDEIISGARDGAQPMNCPCGEWDGTRFKVTHGRHRFTAALIAGFGRGVLVRWIVAVDYHAAVMPQRAA
jgi:hypothetical protein